MAEVRYQPQTTAQSRAEIDQGLRSYMMGVYNYMALGVALTAIITMAVAASPAAMATVYSLKWVFFIAIIGMGIAIEALTWGGANHVATWTFALLWVMRLSAKFNLFLGVRNRGEEFLPPHLLYLASYFRRRKINALLPLSVLAGTVVAVAMITSAIDASGAARTGLLLVASMLVLALIEHVLLVTPLPPTLLWRWALRPATPAP